MTDYTSDYEFDTYQAWTEQTAVYTEVCTTNGERLIYCVLGLVEEAGEVAGKLKKRIRKGGFAALEPGSVVTWKKGDANFEESYESFIEALQAEYGDTLWYLARGLAEAGLSAGKTAAANRLKLLARKARGVIRGEGDQR